MTPAEAALLTARRTRLGDVPLPPGTSMIWTNQRPESRSYRIRGSLVKFGETGVITEAKKLSIVVSRTPSATPLALLNVRSRPLTATTNWLGPTAPIESGGKAPVSASVAPVQLVDGGWATAGPAPGHGPPSSPPSRLATHHALVRADTENPPVTRRADKQVRHAPE